VQAVQGGVEVLDCENQWLVGQQPLDGPMTPRHDPFDKIHRKDFVLAIDAHLLQIVKKPGFDRITPQSRRPEQRDQRRSPGVQLAG
jgi:hypothetical protein